MKEIDELALLTFEKKKEINLNDFREIVESVASDGYLCVTETFNLL
jgi:hypothetical protein